MIVLAHANIVVFYEFTLRTTVAGADYPSSELENLIVDYKTNGL